MRDSDTFCALCGATVVGNAADKQQYGDHWPKNGRLRTVFVLSAVWAFIALASGSYFFFATDSVVGFFEPMPTVWDMLNGISFARDDFYDSIRLTGATLMASGAMAALTTALVRIRKLYIVALVACIISSIFGLYVLVGFVGFIVAYMIYNGKSEFITDKTN